MDKIEQLDAAKRRFLDAKQEIDTLRQAIAEAICPLKIGERITVEEDGKQYDGVIDTISPDLTADEMLEPVVGAATGWCVSGKRIKKTDGTVSKWSFGVPSSYSKLEAGKWVIKIPSLAERFGL